jgi:kynurenine formamidase
MRRLIDLSQPVRPGQVTHPGLPGPECEPFRSREEYRRATGTTFQIDRVTMVGNTGTYLDSPFHRFADAADLAALPLEAVADLPVVVVQAGGSRAVDAGLLTDRLGPFPVAGHAVLLHTGGDTGFGTPDYGVEAPHLTADGAAWLADRRPALVGLDAVNIDALEDVTRPAHTILLGHGILVLEHLTNLAALPSTGARLHAAPVAWHGIGTWPVRAYAVHEPTADVCEADQSEAGRYP